MHLTCSIMQNIHQINDIIFSRGGSLLAQLFSIEKWMMQNDETLHYCERGTKARYEQGKYTFWSIRYSVHKKNMKSRRVPVIALCDSNNIEGRHFMNLYIRKRINSNKWYKLYIDDEVINRVK